MSEPFLGQIGIFGFNFAPRGWAFCDGQLLSISQNTALFALLGTTYGGNGQTTFALPDLRGRTPIHFDSGPVLGESGGAESHTLSAAELPAHTHPAQCTNVPGTSKSPVGNVSAGESNGAIAVYSTVSNAALNAGAVTSSGGGQAARKHAAISDSELRHRARGNLPVAQLKTTAETDPMTEPFVGEIRMFAGNFAPRSYAFCSGQLLSIAQNTALFSLLGTTYGGNGQTTFALPDLRGRIPIHRGQGPGLSNRDLGSTGGTESVTLSVNQIPAHSHPARSATGGNSITPVGNYWSTDPGGNSAGFHAAHDGSTMGSVIGPAGGSQPHDNLQPFLCISFIIALEGIFPSRN